MTDREAPEVLAAAKPDGGHARPRPPAGRQERHISAGPQALAAMARWLGLPAHLGWRLKGFCGLGRDQFRLSLDHDSHRLVFHLLPRSAPGAIVRTARLALAADQGDRPAVAGLLKAAAARLGRRGPQDILRLLTADPRSFVEELDPQQTGDAIKVPCVGQPFGLLGAGWRNFFADQDFDILLGVPQCVPAGTVNISYADRECYYARPRLSFRKLTFLDWPEDGEDGDPDRSQSGTDLVTELEERDMILGTGARADALVAEVRRQAASGKFLIFTHLCTPIIMGEDFQGLARRCEREVGGTAVSWSQKDRDQQDNFGEHFRRVLGQPGFFARPGDKAAVNLFHFPKRYRDAELRPFLEALGLTVNVCLLPDVDFTSIPDLPQAAWQVFCERSSYPTKIRELLARSPRTVATVPAPYGLEGTRQCLRGIAAATGRTGAFAAAWRKTRDGFMPSWNEMRREAAGCRLAFVVSEATLPRLLHLRYGYGAPLASMVQEMGFGIDLLYYDIHGAAPTLPAGLREAQVATFRSPWELEQALKDSRAQAVFSDIFFDWRISRAGKARFASKDFEMGLAGAQRTFQKLLAACRMPFYRRYAAHLARVPRKNHD